MLKYALKRTGYGFLVLLGIVVIVFVLFNLIPADAARMTMGQRSDLSSLEAVNKELGLDKSKGHQFLLYINDLSPIGLHETSAQSQKKYNYTPLINIGEEKVIALKAPYLRRSYQSRKRVTSIIAEKFPGTAVLALSSMFFATVLGIILGVIAALKKDKWQDKLALSISTLGISMPSFFSAIIIAWIFGFLLAEYTGLNMTGSLYEYDAFDGKYLSLKNLILPMLTLGIRPLAIIVQLTRNSMLDVLKKDYIRTAIAKGLPNRTIVFKHALKNALNPVVTAVSGWLASLLAGAFFVEIIFGWNGIGKATVEALGQADFPVVMGAILFVGAIFVVLNIIVDIIYGLIDPRIKLD